MSDQNPEKGCIGFSIHLSCKKHQGLEERLGILISYFEVVIG